MAINPETQYPGKIAPSSAEYPFGKARNITLPGDGTGTPWEAALVNDIFGFQQALLSEVGATPSGDPEKVGASQYLQAMKRIAGLVITSVSQGFNGLTAEDGQRVFSIGWHDGQRYGGGFFEGAESLSKDLHDGGKFISPTVPGVEDQAGGTLAERIANFNAGAGETDPGGTGIFVRLGAEFRPENYGVFIYDSKDDAEAGFDSSGAFMDAVTASRGTGVLVFPEKKFINVGAGVKTQPDGIFAGSVWQANRCALVRTQPGIGLLIQGGAAYQDIDDIEVLCSSALAATEFDAVYDNVAMSITPNTDNRGIVVLNTRVNLKARSSGHAGFNFQIQSTSANSNASTYDLLGGGSGACDCYVNGTDDNISVSRFNHRTSNGFGALFWIEGSAAVRNWDCWIYNENGMQDPATGLPTQCYIGGAIESEFWIYSENQNSALQSAEILADSFSAGNRIVSARQNKDEDTETDSSNRWYAPSGDPEKPFSSRRGFVQTFRNRGARAAQREEATLVSVSGNDGAYGQLRGGFYGIGFSKSDQDGANREFETGIKRNAVNNRFAIDGTEFVDETFVSKGSVESPTGLNGTETPYLKRVFARSSDGEWAKLAEIEVGYISGGLAANTRSEIIIRGYRFQSIIDLARIDSANGDIEALRQGAGFVLKSPDGTRYRITVDNAGNLSTVAV